MINITIPNPYGGNHRNYPKTVIVHGMGEYIRYKGKWLHAVDFLMAVKLSAHFLITPSGIGIRLRDDTERASHALAHNTDTLGIEFLVPGTYTHLQQLYDNMKTDWVTIAAYDKGLQICEWWKSQHLINQFTTHHKVDPDRKQDPGTGFPSQFLFNLNG